jgi:hypothetical protein
MTKLPKTLSAWQAEDFASIFKKEVAKLDVLIALLQQGLSHSSYAKDDNLTIIVLNKKEDNKFIEIKTGIFYFGMIAGCNCADDPSPVDEINEYCELNFKVDKLSSETKIILLDL